MKNLFLTILKADNPRSACNEGLMKHRYWAQGIAWVRAKEDGGAKRRKNIILDSSQGRGNGPVMRRQPSQLNSS